MPFVTEHNVSLVLKTLAGKIPKDIYTWKPYKKPIYFLSQFDKNEIFYYKLFCENPSSNIISIYEPIKGVDTNIFVFEGGKPSYHKYENCERLTSSFTNFKIPEAIKEKGKEAIDEFRMWFKENQTVFTEKPDIYQMRLHAKYSILQSIEKVEYKNSGNVYKENLTLVEIESRIDSILHNAAAYYKRDIKRQGAIKLFQKTSFLAFKRQEILNNTTSYNDLELKVILKEYHNMFVQPTKFYLKEHFKILYNATIEIDEKIFEHLNFKKCGQCFADDYEQNTQNILDKKKKLIETFGEYEFPIEPTQFHFKNIENSELRIAFIYCRIIRCNDKEFQTNEHGNFKKYKAEFINHENKFIYASTNIYENDIPNINLFRKYLTKIEQNRRTREAVFTTYNIEI